MTDRSQPWHGHDGAGRRSGRWRLGGAPAGLAVALLAQGGCTLLGQRDFAANADKPPAVVNPFLNLHPKGPPPALVVIRLPSPPSEWEGPLKSAVGMAVARKPDVQFTVTSVVPKTGDLEAQRAALSEAVRNGRLVADRMVSDGVDRGQVEMAASADPSVKQDEVRLTVR